MIRPGFTTATHSSGFPLPLPIRVSAGFFVTGLSGKIRIQILPPRLRLRASATRAASICRLVPQPGSSAFSPYSPNASVAPRCAVPRIRPRWAFRYLTRLGISTRGVPSGFRRRGAQHFALEDPDLDADRPVRRVGGREPVVDVRADRMERHAAVAVPLLARDLAAAQPPRARDPDAVGAQAQRGGDRLLHGAAERDTLLELERHVLRHELGVELGVDDLLNVEIDLLARPRLQLVLQLLHLRALPADDDARPGRRDRDPRPVGRALDVDLGDTRVIELILDVAPDLHVLVQQICVALRREPAGAPRPRRTESEADRMRLLAHPYVFSLDFDPLALDPLDLEPLGFAAPFRAASDVGRAAARGVYWSVASASPTDFPRIWSSTSRAFRADTRTKRARASVRTALRLPRGRGRSLLGRAVRLERAGHRELTQPVTDHVLRDVDRDELLAVVNGERVADELRRDRRAARPRLQHLLLPAPVQLLHPREQRLVDVRPLLERTPHRRLLFLPSRHDVAVRGPRPATGLVALGGLAPRGHRVIALALALAAAHRVVDGVHHRAAHRRAEAEPAHPARLPDRYVLVVEVAHLPDRRHAVDRHHPHLARRQLERRPLALLRQELRLRAGAPAHLRATARL